ncbi:MAG: CvpA family protein [Anaerolineae bacterium]|jgi:uncharacterized membrane protein required for colicin V production
MPSWLNPFDVLIVFSVLVGTVLGFVRGLVRMLLTLAVLYVAAVLGLTLHRPFSNWIIYIFGLPESISLGLAFLLIVAVASIIMNFVLRRTYKDTELPGIRQIDQLGGMIIGFLVTCVWIGFAILVLAFFLTAPDTQTTGLQQNVLDYFRRSALVPIFYDFLGIALATLKPWMPRGLPPELFRIP